MTIADDNLNALLQQLSPRNRKIISECLREGAVWTDEAKMVLRWIKRKLKRRVRSRRR